MTNAFIVADETSKQAVLFDAPDHTVGPLLDEVAKKGWDLIGLWLTHGHFDHFADHSVVRSKFPSAKVLIHELDLAKAQHPEVQTRVFGLPFKIEPLRADAFVSDGQKLSLGTMEATVIHTPGHSPGHVAYYFPEARLLVGGDLIIGGSIGRTDLPDSDHVLMEQSVRKIMALPEATRLLGGHGAASTLAAERVKNPFVREILSEG